MDEQLLQDTQVETQVDQIESEGIENTEAGQDTQGEQVETLQEEIPSWDKDKRFGSMWKDPNDMYRSYRNMEKTLSPLQQKIKEFESKVVPEYQKNLQERDTRLQELEPIEKTVQFLQGNERYRNEILQVIEKLEEEDKRIKYGDLPPEAIQKLEKAEEIERKFQAFEEEKQQEKNISALSGELEKVQGVAKEYGLEYDEAEFVQYLKHKNVQPEEFDRIEGMFLQKAIKHIANSVSKTAQTGVVQNLESNRKKALPASNGRTLVNTNKPKSLDDKMREAFRQSQ